MIDDRVLGDGHDKFKKLSALAFAGGLGPLELSELQAHLEECRDCREVFSEYRMLTTQGMAHLTSCDVAGQPHQLWDEESARRQLLARVRADRPGAGQPQVRAEHSPEIRRSGWFRLIPIPQIAVAACALIALVLGAYHLGVRSVQPKAAVVPASFSADDRLQKSLNDKRALDDLLATQTKKLVQLQMESVEKEDELRKLQAAMRALDGRSNQLVASNAQSESQIRELSLQRDHLSDQLQAATQAYESSKLELANLRAEHDKTVIQTSSLEAKNRELAGINRDQERRLRNSEQYLNSDRDIRELMGARQLYIADVFDVDASSHTQRPFGRVFYTQGKSLIFYAFDLDREPGVVNASTFQVWGQREAPQGEQPLPMNLGILYMDNESNRRWVMRFDDPKQLAEIDAVFVTVEPRGGSHKPTGKPFLYALLRKEPNHP
jgi:Putative zinc-finger